MKEIKTTRTIEEITGYEAFDGTWFSKAETCKEYESSAICAAKAAAWHYFVDEKGDYDLFNNDSDVMATFDVPDVKAYEVIRHWMELDHVWNAKDFTPDYVGKRIGLLSNEYDNDYYFSKHVATKEAAIEYYMKSIEAMFADKEIPETK